VRVSTFYSQWHNSGVCGTTKKLRFAEKETYDLGTAI
jgi:hypothetical protein